MCRCRRIWTQLRALVGPRGGEAVGRLRAAIGSFVFLLVAPGVVAGLVPWLLTDWSAHDWPIPLRLIGAAVIVAGLALVLPAFARFAIDGRGTPAPVAPTERLVVTGAYRYVRNPMYLGVAALIVGQGLLLGQAVLLAYAAIFVVVVTAIRAWLRGADPRKPVRPAIRDLQERGPALASTAPPVDGVPMIVR